MMMMNANKDNQIAVSQQHHQQHQQQDEEDVCNDGPSDKLGRLALSHQQQIQIQQQQKEQLQSKQKQLSKKGDKLLKRFPFRLNAMLNDAETHGNEHIFSWLPCGKMFKVHKHKEFAARIMPLYCRHSKYKSFLRQLSMYKFIRINDGPLRGAYHHPSFERNRFDLIERVNRKERDSQNMGKEDTFGSAVAAAAANGNVSKSAATAAMKRSRVLPDESSLSSSDAGGAEDNPDNNADDDDNHHLELIDFDSEEDASTPNRSNRKIGPAVVVVVEPLGKPLIQDSSTVAAMYRDNTSAAVHHRRSQSLRANFCDLKGIFHLQPDNEASAVLSSRISGSISSTIQQQHNHPHQPTTTTTVFPQLLDSPMFLANTPEDITQEIIKTFGRHGSSYYSL